MLEIYQALLAHYGPQGWWPSDGPFETIAGAILGQNTAWRNAEKAIKNLKHAGVLSPEHIRSIPDGDLALLIRPSGYFNSKTKKLKAIANYLLEYDDDFDKMNRREPKELRSSLLEVYGIGPETADDIVLYALGLPSFVVDNYTRRILTRLGVQVGREKYEVLQALFEENLSRDSELFKEYHALFDRHAIATCFKQRPACQECCILNFCDMGKRLVHSG